MLLTYSSYTISAVAIAMALFVLLNQSAITRRIRQIESSVEELYTSVNLLVDTYAQLTDTPSDPIQQESKPDPELEPILLRSMRARASRREAWPEIYGEIMPENPYRVRTDEGHKCFATKGEAINYRDSLRSEGRKAYLVS